MEVVLACQAAQTQNAKDVCGAGLGRASGSIVLVLFLGAWYNVKPFLDCYRAGAGSKVNDSISVYYIVNVIIREMSNGAVPDETRSILASLGCQINRPEIACQLNSS